MKESKIENYGVVRTGELGGIGIKLTSSNNRGLPDRMHFFPNGILVFVEYKSPGRKPRPNQIRWHNRLKHLGFTVAVISSLVGVDAMINWVKGKLKRVTRPPCIHEKECKFYEPHISDN